MQCSELLSPLCVSYNLYFYIVEPLFICCIVRYISNILSILFFFLLLLLFAIIWCKKVNKRNYFPICYLILLLNLLSTSIVYNLSYNCSLEQFRENLGFGPHKGIRYHLDSSCILYLHIRNYYLIHYRSLYCIHFELEHKHTAIRMILFGVQKMKIAYYVALLQRCFEEDLPASYLW